ncbi:HAMP domain-containing histidine kinase [Brevibacterium luteolum]|uniref:sensor histidine kinase n=1 Tax=Brevibacterium luteolum TaxID=199591 RepID=UPI00223AA05C|nr:HAMP domain-containing sensor histidine kinase [Brevibacterium luteolum]MCT1920774.1 HAMP domain-containing histidine kinase [Brevibacterium luteolum]
MTTKQSGRLPRHHRFSARTRLAFSYAVLVIICGVVLLTVLVAYLGFGPEYSFGPVAAHDDGESVIIVPDHPEGGSFAVEVQSREDLITLLITVSAVVLTALSALSSVAAWWLAGRMLRPLARINEAARIAASGRLDHRIGLSGPRDEIVNLAQTFDAMLDSIERYNASQRRFAANASHELRTPLAATKTIIDVELAKPDPVNREVLERLAHLNARSTRTVESLLDLAEIEAGEEQTTAVELDEITSEVIDQYVPAASARGLSVERHLAPAVAQGEGRLLIQMVQNLVENAVRHNCDDGLIRVCTAMAPAAEGAAEAQLRIESSGRRLDPKVVAGLTEPFRTGQGRAAGNSRGLGLAIVAAIVDRSHGRLDLAARPGGGLIVTVTLPRAEANPAAATAQAGAADPKAGGLSSARE